MSDRLFAQLVWCACVPIIRVVLLPLWDKNTSKGSNHTLKATSRSPQKGSVKKTPRCFPRILRFEGRRSFIGSNRDRKHVFLRTLGHQEGSSLRFPIFPFAQVVFLIITTGHICRVFQGSEPNGRISFILLKGQGTPHVWRGTPVPAWDLPSMRFHMHACEAGVRIVSS